MRAPNLEVGPAPQGQDNLQGREEHPWFSQDSGAMPCAAPNMVLSTHWDPGPAVRVPGDQTG